MHRHAPRLPLRQPGLPIAGSLDRQGKRLLVSRMLVTHQCIAIRHRVLTGLLRQLIDQGFHDVRGVSVAHRPPPQHRHVDLGTVQRQTQRHGVRRAGHALHTGAVDAVLDHHLLERRTRQNGLTDDGVIPREDVALVVEADFGAVHVHGTVVAAMDVVFAAPDDLDRLAMAGLAPCLGDLRRLDTIVGRGDRASPEAPARHERVQLDLLGLEFERACNGRLIDGLELGAGPDFGPFVGELHGAVQRLHGRVREIREAVFRHERFGRALELADVGVDGHGPGRPGHLLVFGQLRRGVDVFDPAGVPLGFERVTSGLRLPVAVGDDGYGGAAPIVGNLQHVAHALDGLRGLGVEAFHFGAEHRRARHDRHLEVGQLEIHAVHRHAGRLGPRVEAAGRLAQQAERRRRFERNIGRHRHGLRPGCEAAVGGALAVGAEDDAVFGFQLCGGHFPLLRRRRNEHGARRRPDATVLQPRVCHGAGTTGHLNAEQGVFVDVGRRRQLAAHLGPVAVEFFGNQHGQRGLHALAEIEAVDLDGDGVVGRDAHERGRHDGRRRGALCGGAAHGAGQRHFKHQAAGRKGGGLEESAAAQAGVVAHGDAGILGKAKFAHVGVSSPQASDAAASLMAARMRA